MDYGEGENELSIRQNGAPGSSTLAHKQSLANKSVRTTAEAKLANFEGDGDSSFHLLQWP